MPRLSAATVLDRVQKGEALDDIATRHSIEEIAAAVRDAKTALHLGLTALDEAALRRADLEGWTIAMVVGHALRADEEAHRIARSLAQGHAPVPDALHYDLPGDAEATRGRLLEGLRASQERIAQAFTLTPAGPTFAHRDLGPLSARGWLLFIGVHDAMHLHQAAGIVRGRAGHVGLHSAG